MEKEIVKAVKDHSDGSNELVFNFKIPPSDEEYNSIEIFGESEDRIRLNIWYADGDEECEFQQVFSELSEHQQQYVYDILNNELKISK